MFVSPQPFAWYLDYLQPTFVETARYQFSYAKEPHGGFFIGTDVYVVFEDRIEKHSNQKTQILVDGIDAECMDAVAVSPNKIVVLQYGNSSFFQKRTVLWQFDINKPETDYWKCLVQTNHRLSFLSVQDDAVRASSVCTLDASNWNELVIPLECSSDPPRLRLQENGCLVRGGMDPYCQDDEWLISFNHWSEELILTNQNKEKITWPSGTRIVCPLHGDSEFGNRFMAIHSNRVQLFEYVTLVDELEEINNAITILSEEDDECFELAILVLNITKEHEKVTTRIAQRLIQELEQLPENPFRSDSLMIEPEAVAQLPPLEYACWIPEPVRARLRDYYSIPPPIPPGPIVTHTIPDRDENGQIVPEFVYRPLRDLYTKYYNHEPIPPSMMMTWGAYETIIETFHERRDDDYSLDEIIPDDFHRFCRERFKI